MLHYQTLDARPYQLLGELMNNQTLKDVGFVLCGDSSLALQLGHRMSTDLDLFTNQRVGPQKLKTFMEQQFGSRIDTYSVNDLGLRAYLDGVKLDLIRFPFDLKHPPLVENNLRILSLSDSSSMKLHAVANRGTRRDYVDLAEVLQKIPFAEVMYNYRNQFSPTPAALDHTKRAVTYFGDAEKTSDKVALLNGRKWDDVKRIVERSVAQPNTIFLKPAALQPVPANPHLAPASGSTITAAFRVAPVNEKPAPTTQKTNTAPAATPAIKPGRTNRIR